MVVAWGFGLCARAVRRLVRLPVLLCCEAVTFVAFPVRMLSAVDRERKLGWLIAEMQEQMDDLVWENGDLEDRLQAALMEQDAMEAVLDEMEEEHEEAFARIHVLEAQLKALKQESMRVKEHRGKVRWDKAADEDARRHHSNKVAKGGGGGEEALKQQQEEEAVALRRSLFSLGMSLAVGAVALSADAPCLPLLAGLFAVVGVSMRSSVSLLVVRRRGCAVALLGLNCFLLGVLTSPVLPGVARWLAATPL